jgi:hypothetical protein
MANEAKWARISMLKDVEHHFEHHWQRQVSLVETMLVYSTSCGWPFKVAMAFRTYALMNGDKVEPAIRG